MLTCAVLAPSAPGLSRLICDCGWYKSWDSLSILGHGLEFKLSGRTGVWFV